MSYKPWRTRCASMTVRVFTRQTNSWRNRPRIGRCDAITGEVRAAQIFVATLGASNLTEAEARRIQGQAGLTPATSTRWDKATPSQMGTTAMVPRRILADLPAHGPPPADRREAAMAKHEKTNNHADEHASQAGTSTAATEPPGPLTEKDYQKHLEKLHVELVHLQRWVTEKGKKVCIVFEGRDGAGKGGVIKAITERVSPRVYRVVALPAPSEREKSQMYVQRYITHLPAAWEIVIFDRSWYNRAGVERVMGLCTEEQAKAFLRMVPDVEKAIIDSGVILLKYWLEVSPDEQTRRLEGRIDDGRKTWKLARSVVRL